MTVPGSSTTSSSTRGWSVEIADAQKVNGLAPLACKTNKIDSLVLATLSQRDPVPAIWLPDRHFREERELACFRLHLVKHKVDAQAPDPALRCRARAAGDRPAAALLLRALPLPLAP
jgi:hypothetical protein